MSITTVSEVERALKKVMSAALQPNSAYRTEYELSNNHTGALATITQCDGAISSWDSTHGDKSNVLRAEALQLRTLWAERVAQWHADKIAAGSAVADTAAAEQAAWQRAMDEQDEEEDDDAEDGEAAAKKKKAARKAKRAAKSRAKADEPETDDMGARGSSLVMLLTGKPHNEAAAQSTMQRSPRQSQSTSQPAANATDTVVDDGVLSFNIQEGMALRDVPVAATQGGCTVTPVVGQPTALLTCSVWQPAEKPSMSGPTKQVGKKKKGGRSPARRSHTATPQPAGEPVNAFCETRLTVQRVVLRALFGLARDGVEMPLLQLPEVDEVVAATTTGAVSKKQRKVKNGGKAQRPEGDDGSPQGMGQAQQTAEYREAVVSSDSDDGDEITVEESAEWTKAAAADWESERSSVAATNDDDAAALRELSAQVVAAYDAQEGLDAPSAFQYGSGGRGALPVACPAGPVLPLLSQFSDAPWVIVICHGGFFAGGIFVRGQPVLHKCFQRYVVRKKQGGKQSSQQGNFGSIGSQIRKAQEIKWAIDVKNILDDWRPLIDAAWAISYVAPGPENRRILTDFAGRQPLKRDAAASALAAKLRPALKTTLLTESPIDVMNDPRVHTAPLTTHRPTFLEVCRIHEVLSSCDMRSMYHAKQAPSVE
jgi:hypothetical protein